MAPEVSTARVKLRAASFTKAFTIPPYTTAELVRSLGPGESAAFGVNDSGTVVGLSPKGNFIFSSGVTTYINPFNEPRNDGYPTSVNGKGDVVGAALNTNIRHNGFLYRERDGSITNIGTFPGGRESIATSINDRGQIVGYGNYPYVGICTYPRPSHPCTKYDRYHAFLYDDGVMTDLNALIPANSGWDLYEAFDINKRGQIVGRGILNGKYRGYLLSPVSHDGDRRPELDDD